MRETTTQTRREPRDVFVNEDEGPPTPRYVIMRAAIDAGCADGVGGEVFVTDAILTALREAGLVIVARDDVVIPAWFAESNGITQAAITETADRIRAALTEGDSDA